MAAASTKLNRTVFDHIPKTAGTSIRTLIATALGESGARSDPARPHHVAIACAGSSRFVHGHLWFYPGEQLAPGWYYATLLRDPIDRFLSQYFFHRQLREQVLSGAIRDIVVSAAVHQDLECYLDDAREDIRRSYMNVQACHFAARVCERPHELDAHTLFEAAVASLEDYDLVGTYADLPEFVTVYCRALELPTQNLPRLNVTSDRKHERDLTKFVAKKLRATNGVDYMILDWARRRFVCQAADSRTASPKRGAGSEETKRGVSFGTREIEILDVECGIFDTAPTAPSRKRARLRLLCRSAIVEHDLTMGLGVRNVDGDTVLASNTKILGVPLAISSPRDFLVEAEFTPDFPAGDYQVTVALHKGVTHIEHCYHWIDGAAHFRVGPGRCSDDDPCATNLTIALR